MLPYKNRLIKRGDFEAVYRQGKPLFCAIIGIKAKRNSLPDSRMGISVGTKFSGKAVERNRIKRQIREIFHKNIDKIKEGFDMVVFVKKEKETKFDTEDLEKMILAALKKGNLIQ